MNFNPLLDLGRLKAAEVIELHDASKRYTRVPGVLGDGHLYKQVLPFRNIRDVFEHLGGTFTTGDPMFYRELSFAALPTLLKTWEVPIVENAKALKHVVAKTAHRLDAAPFVHPSTGLQKNFLIHEASHCLFDRLVPVPKSPKGLAQERAMVLRALMGEAFANTTAAMCATDINTKADLLFYTVNDYGYCLFPRRGDLLKRAVHTYGYRTAFKLLYLGHLILKFLLTSISAQDLTAVLPLWVPDFKLPKRDVEWVTQMVNSMLVGHDFLIDLHRFYFHLVGLKAPVEKLLSFDYLDAILSDPELFSSLDVMADITENGLEADLRRMQRQ